MPLLRAYERHWAARIALRRGNLTATATGDTHAFRFPVRPPRVGTGDSPIGMNVLDGDLLVYGWKPLYGYVGGVGYALFSFGLVAVLLAVTGPEPEWRYTAAITFPLGILILIWFFLGAYPRLVIFDRRRGLVHLPRWFGRRRLDAVRFADANVLVVDMPSGYMGLEPLTQVYVSRPGWSLWRREYPPWHARIDLGALASEVDDEAAEQSWRQIVTFMTEPRETSVWIGWTVYNTAATVELSYGDDWAAMRRAEARSLRRLYGSELLTEPNWVCDEEGRWRRLPEGPRERIELPDGPEEKRVPV